MSQSATSRDVSATAAASADLSASAQTTWTTDEADELRKQLRAALQSINRREPLEPTYKRLLLGGLVTRRSPVIPRDKFYKRLPSRLRERVEAYQAEMQGKDPFDRISQRQALEEAAMRTAFTLREAKDHEQLALLEATLAAKAMHPIQKRHLDGMVLQLQARKDRKLRSMSPTNVPASTSSASKQSDHARRAAELEATQIQARKREEMRLRREAERQRRKKEEMERARADTPQQALHKMIEPIFQKLWDMTFDVLGGTNPFRVIIDRTTCISLDAPDYCDIIKKPMNLTYIRNKIRDLQYENLQQFFADLELMIDNAIVYNSDLNNPYRIAADDMKRRNAKLMKKVHEKLQAQAQAANAANATK